MKLISHRGNINGPIPEMENNPEYIQKALDLGYDVEVDVWGTKYGAWYLGHDGPEYLIDAKFLRQKGLWCHAKEIRSFYRMTEDPNIHCFAHDTDFAALTSEGYFWTSWSYQMTKKSICVMPPLGKDVPNYVAGVCSDYIEGYK